MKNYFKENIKNLPFIFIAFIMFYGITTFATSYLFDSKDVSFDNSNNDILADDVQGAIDELYACATKYADFDTSLNTLANSLNSYNLRLTALENTNSSLPVGSIYISSVNTNPSSFFGGTWEAFGEGRTLIGVGSNGTTNYSTAGDTGGSETHTLTVNNLPEHNHSIPSLSGSTNTTGSHAHRERGYYRTSSGVSNGAQVRSRYSLGEDPFETIMESAGNHSHTVTTNASNTNGCTDCNGTAFSTQDPYITVYMWKRTA